MDREAIDEIKRHFGVVIEDVKSDVRAVAEGVDALRTEMHFEFGAIRKDVAREFDDTRALIRLSYGELDRRMRSLEGEVDALRARVERLEEKLAS
jgi:ABC-type phosphate transport system auxiliary subunit